VALLRKRLRAAPAIAPERIQALIADLDHMEFTQREKASRELKKLEVAAELALQAIRERPPSAKVRRRVEAILASPPPWPPQDAEALRRTRAVQMLERIGSPAAALVLDAVAGGAPAARETRLAEAAGKRLAERPPSPGTISSGRRLVRLPMFSAYKVRVTRGSRKDGDSIRDGSDNHGLGHLVQPRGRGLGLVGVFPRTPVRALGDRPIDLREEQGKDEVARAAVKPSDEAVESTRVTQRLVGLAPDVPEKPLDVSGAFEARALPPGEGDGTGLVHAEAADD
jgi:hypothetical protein